MRISKWAAGVRENTDRVEPAPDRPSFEEVYRATSDHVQRTLWRYGVPARDLPDIVHEVFLTVERRLQDFDPALDARAWVGGIAWRIASRYRRLARHRGERLVAEGEIVEAIDAGPGPEQEAVSGEVERLVRAILQKIREEDRIVVILHDMDGIKGPAIASALGLPEGTVWTRLRNGRAAFKDAVRRLSPGQRELLLSRLALLPGLAAVLDVEQGGAAAMGAAELARGAGQVARRAAGQVARGAGQIALGTGQLAVGAAAVFALGAATGAGTMRAWEASAPMPAAIVAVAPEPSAATAVPSAAPSGEPSPASEIEGAPEADAPPSAAPDAPVAPMTSAARGATTRSSAVSSLGVAGSDTDGALLRRAGAALASGDAVGALALLERHGARYPRSTRAQEREAAMIQALARAGRRGEAWARAERFRKAYPGSILLPAVEAAVGAR